MKNTVTSKYFKLILMNLSTLTVFTVYFLIFSCFHEVNGQTAITYGEKIQGIITLPSQINVYTFTGETNDVVRLRMGKNSGNLWPKLVLYDPSLQIIAENHNPVCANILTGTLPFNGTYTVYAMDGFSGTNTGDYGLMVQNIINPGYSSSLLYNMTITDTITYAGYFDTYTFEGTLNDLVTIQMSKISGNLWPLIDLFDPNGILLQSNHSPITATITVNGLPYSGQYTILSMDGFSGTNTGQYALSLTGVHVGIENFNNIDIEFSIRQIHNQTSDELIIEIINNIEQFLYFEIFGLTGKTMSKTIYQLFEPGVHKFFIKKDSLRTGIYLLEARNSKGQRKIIYVTVY